MVEFAETLPQGKELREATAHLDAGRFDQARKALEAMKDGLARLPAEATTQRMVAVATCRLGESLQRIAMERARETRNDATAQLTLADADREFSRLTGDDFGTAQEGSSLRAAALRSRLQIHTTLYCGYRDLAMADPRVVDHRTKRDAHARTANGLVAQLKNSFAAATLPDGRRIAAVASEEAAALQR